MKQQSSNSEKSNEVEYTPAQNVILLNCKNQIHAFTKSSGYGCYSDNYGDSDGYRDGGEWS